MNNSEPSSALLGKRSETESYKKICHERWQHIADYLLSKGIELQPGEHTLVGDYADEDLFDNGTLLEALKSAHEDILTGSIPPTVTTLKRYADLLFEIRRRNLN